MGLSFRKLGSIADAIGRQVNPFDNGKTAKNVQGNAPAQKAAGTPAPSFFQQATHNGLTNTVGNMLVKPFVMNPAQIVAETGRGLAADVTNNAAAENAGAARMKANLKASIPGFIANQAINTGKTLADVPYAVAGDVQSAFTGKAPSQRFAKAQQAGTRAFNQTIPGALVRPATAGIAAVTHMSPQDQAANGLDPNATGAQKYFADPVTAAAAILGAKTGVEAGVKAPVKAAVQTIKDAKSFSDVAPNLTALPGKTVAAVKSRVTPLDQSGHIAIPNIRAYGKSIALTPENGYEAVPTIIKDAQGDPVNIYSKVQKAGTNVKGSSLVRNWYDASGNKLTNAQADAAIKGDARMAGIPKVKQQAVAKAPVKAPAAAKLVSKKTGSSKESIAPLPTGAHTSIPEINTAIDRVSKEYSARITHTGTIDDVINKANGHASAGTRAANQLRIALAKHLTKAENQAVSDFLDGHPTEDLTPKAFEVGNALKGLHDQAFDLRKSVAPKTNRVTDYVSRIPSDSLRASAVRSGKVLGAIRNLSDVHNLRSVFNEERKVGKFVGPKGPVYGTAKRLGLTDKGNGTFVDSAGTTFQRTAVSKRELEANGAGTYEHNISRIQGIYHSDTLSLKARADAINSLVSDPNAHGLFTQKQVDDGVAPPDVQPIEGVSGIKDSNGDPLYASKKDAKNLHDRLGFNATKKSGPVGKAYDAVSNFATQLIVLNPFFHGMNQLYQSAIAAGNMPGHGTGWVKVAEGVMKANEEDVVSYLKNGGHVPDYGSKRSNLMSKLTGGATKLNSKSMAAIELKLRSGLYKASVDSGMKPKDAVANIDRFLGDQHAINQTVRRITLFAHYFKTMAGAVGHQIAHPVEQKGSIANATLLAAITAGVSYGYQQTTGNKDAYVRLPGELGLIKEAVTSVKDITKGNLPSLATNRINPVAKEITQQGFNKDIFTDQKVTDSAGGRLGHAEQALVAPAGTVSKVTSGKRNVTEMVTNQLGLNTPHAKGYQAAPKIPILNTPKALSGTGEEAQKAYFDGLNTLKRSLGGDKKATDALNSFLDKNHDPVTGGTIQNSPSESQQSSLALFSNDKLRNAVQKFERNQPSHDPMWDLSPDKLKILEQYKGQFTGDAAKANIADNNPWIHDVQAASSAYYNNLPHTPGSKPSVPNGPVYPKFDDATQTLMSTYNAATADERSKLMNAYPVQLSDAFSQISDWTNAMRKAEGAPELKDYPRASPEVEQILKTYNALPKGNGKNGGSPDRYAWITANPDAYAKMQNYLTQTSVQSLIKNASMAQFKGTEPSQQLLKDIKNVGQYDIATTTDAAGNKTYSINPALAYSQGGSAVSSSGSSSSSSYARYKRNKEIKYLGNPTKFMVHPSIKSKRIKASFKKSPGSKHFTVKTNKIAKNKRSGLNRKVTLKTKI